MKYLIFHESQLYQKEDSSSVRDGAAGKRQEDKSITSFEEQYQEIALNCFRYLDFKSFEQVDRLTFPEYKLLMEAVKLKEVDKDYRNHLQAFLNLAVKAKKKAGKNKQKPVFSRFKQFYDYEKEIEKVRKKESIKTRFSGIDSLLKKGV